MRNRLQHRHQVRQGALGNEGFTLVEVLVAIAILSLGLTALFAVIANGTSRTMQAEKQAQAVVLAQSLVARVGVNVSVRTTRTGGEQAGGYRWRLDISPYDERGLSEQGVIGAYVVSAAVTWREGSHERSYALTTLRLGSSEARR